MDKLLEISADTEFCYWGTKEWRTESNRTFLCSYCNCIQNDWYPRPIDVVLEEFPDDRLTGHIWTKGISIFRSDFIELIGDYLKGYVFGQCFLSDGTVVDKFVTCYTNEWIVIRGSRKTRYSECPECGKVCARDFIADEYTLRCYLQEDIRIYQDCCSSLYIDEDLAMELDFSPWPDVKLKPIPILDEPVDNIILPCDPPGVQWGEEFF